MIKVENVEVYNIARAVYSVRNAMNSWDKSDSDLKHDILGSADLDLAKRLFKAGSEHRKYLRQIFVSMDITAPLYWWKEMDTYKVGTASNSCSTMHKITSKPITLSDFSTEEFDIADEGISMNDCFLNVIADCEMLRKYYLETNDKKYWRGLIQLLPSSYNQKRTITMNYENVFNIIHQRTGHKLDEWREFVNVLKDLPYVKEIMEDEDGNS